MGIIVRNLSSVVSNIRMGGVMTVLPFTFDSRFSTMGMSHTDIEKLIIGENNIQGSVSDNVSVVFDETLNKSVFQFSANTSIKFPAVEPRLTGRNFRIKYNVLQNGNNTNYAYYHETSNPNTLLFGHSPYWNRIIVNNNSGTPKINASVNTQYVNKWAEFEWSYNRTNNHWQMWIDGVRYINSTWSIQPYSKVEEFLRFDQGTGNKLDYYKIQVEGLNWSGDFNEAW